ncbi:MAG: hypothetical protein M1827_005256 [Pycnora praestabilis]|nr:MAG: hypothetical protein M1827_005256 [Pycnora praestabilis]
MSSLNASTYNPSDLAGLGLHNGSLQIYGKDVNLDLEIYNKTTAGLIFNTNVTNFPVLISALTSLYRDDVFSYPPVCTYAISGQYGFLPRLIYYVFLIFSLILRRHIWLSSAALGYAMSYASVACVHVFALLARYKYKLPNYADPSLEYQPPNEYGDIDLVAIFPILVTGCIMLTPILNWSTTVRNYEAQPVVVYWGFLMFAALIASLTKFSHAQSPFPVYTQVATCELNVTNGCTFDQVTFPNGSWRTTPENVVMRTSLDFYNKCNCNDTCGAIGITGIPFRKGTNLQAFLTSDRTQKIQNGTLFWVFLAINIIFLFFVIAQGILGLIEARWDQAEVRNGIFRFLGGRKRPDNPTFQWKCRYAWAKTTSGTFYLIAVIAAIICPLVFVASIIVNEILVRGFPVGEEMDAVGQWSTWVGAGFVVVAAVISRYNRRWEDAVKDFFRYVFGKAGPKVGLNKGGHTQNNNVIKDIKDVFIQCEIPFVYAWESIAGAWRRLVIEWVDFRHWRNDPFETSVQKPYYWQTQVERDLPRHNPWPRPPPQQKTDSMLEKSTRINVAHTNKASITSSPARSSLTSINITPANDSTLQTHDLEPRASSPTPSELDAHATDNSPFMSPPLASIASQATDITTSPIEPPISSLSIPIQSQTPGVGSSVQDPSDKTNRRKPFERTNTERSGLGKAGRSAN